MSYSELLSCVYVRGRSRDGLLTDYATDLLRTTDLYMHTHTHTHTHTCLLTYILDIYYTGASGIATGWSTLVHTYHPLDVLANVSSAT